MSDNSVWFKFIAQDSAHQLVIKGNVPLDGTIYHFDDIDSMAYDSVNYSFIDLSLEFPPSPWKENAGFLTIDSIAMTFLNFDKLVIGEEYLIKLGFNLTESDFFSQLILINEDRLLFEYEVCLKTKPPPPENNSHKTPNSLDISEDFSSLVHGTATSSPIDEAYNYNCFYPSNFLTDYVYSDAWFSFKANQNSHTLYLENFAVFESLTEILSDKLDENWHTINNLDLHITVYKEGVDSIFTEITCNKVDSIFALNDLEIDSNYYVRAYYNCVNYLTDLDFGIAVSNLTDQDEDGFLSDVDCDDEDSQVYPGAEEVCDLLDNNCNGEVDEGVIKFTFYNDLDNDGFGNTNDSILSCFLPDGYVENSLDCDDENPNMHPEIQEICDSLDNDCNGLIDDGLQMNLYYLDSDNDGYGDENMSVNNCSQPEGYVDNDLDCDDSNPEIHPLSDELCDFTDNNCDGNIDEGFELFEFYLDQDDDGFGNIDSVLLSCKAPDGYIDNYGDCDDTNPNINPLADEIYDNDVDENCDGSITSVEHIYFREIGLDIFPNPTSGEVNISMNRQLTYKVKLLGIDGKLIKSYLNITKFDITDLDSGVYIMIVEFENANYIKRLIKI